MIFIFILIFYCKASCPTAQVDYTLNLASNGDFQNPVIPAGQDYLEGPHVKIEGWDSDIMQLGRGTKFNSLWGNTQVIEMDTTKNQNYTKVQTMTAGRYMLSFQYAARQSKPVSTSGLGVHWNGVLIFSIISTDKLIHTENIFIEAVDGQNTLILQARGASDKYGMSVDNVFIYQVEEFNRVSNGTSCECQYGYFDDGINWTCILCSSVSPGCLHCEYDNTTGGNFSFTRFTCVHCPSSDFSDGAFCEPCQNRLENCQSCTADGLSCNSCSSDTFMYDLTEDNFSLASSLTGYNTSIFNGTVCLTCQIQGCINCSSLITCFQCNQTDNYFINTTQLCETCSLQGCINCSSLSACQICNETANYFINSSTQLCQICSLQGCVKCLTLETCSECNNTLNYYKNQTTLLCQVCVLEGCTNCSTLQVCYQCNETANYYINITTDTCEICQINMCLQCLTLYSCELCDYNSSYYELSGQCEFCNGSDNYFINISTLNCQPCTLLQCLNCSSLTQCIQCNQTAFYFLNEQTLICEQCKIEGCLTCISPFVCLICDEPNGYYFSSDNSSICYQCNISCNCNGYYSPWNGSQCSTICGDGLIRVDEECDDLNADDHDGCSSACTVENHFLCDGEPSNCTFTSEIDVQFVSVQSKGCNDVLIVLKLDPNVPILHSQTLSTIISFENENITLESISSDNKNVTVKASYTYDVLDPIVIHFNPTNYYFFITSNFSTLSISYTPLIPLLYFSEEQCQVKDLIHDYLLAMEIGSYVFLFLSIILSCKIVGLEMMGILQLLYFDMAFYDFINLYVEPFLSLKSVNGLNLQFFSENKDLPEILQQMQVSSLFLNNLNIMLILTVGLFLISLSLIGIGSYHKVSNCKKVGKRLLKEGIITLVLFNIFNISFSAGIYWKYGQNQSYLHAAVLYLVLGLLIILIIAMEVSSKKYYGEYKKKFKPTFPSSFYIFITILYRFSLGIFISSNHDSEIDTVIILSFSIAFIMYNIINLPFVSFLHNYRANTIHITQFIILMVTSYYRSMKSTTPIEVKGRIYDPAIVILAAVALCFLASFFVLVYQGVKFCKKCSKSKKIHEQKSPSKINETMNNFQEANQVT